MKSKTYLFVDGSNLYGGQYELFGPSKYLDFDKFIKEIEDNLQINFDKIFFYASYSPKPKNITKKQKLYLKNEGLFYKSVKNTKNTTFFTGYRSKTSGKEKEVDVKLTADLVSFAYQKKFEKVFLFSGDADFLQALFTIKSLSKHIYVMCIQNKVMYRATFHFKTYIFGIEEYLKLKFLRFQKFEYFKLKEKDVSCKMS
ncbi:NYN domain-containing protein [Candidatus Gottesmanbacteria bacterium]|nr:NYN domain-containing protein [Candidatus Gottesmanbacteria bacterium]